MSVSLDDLSPEDHLARVRKGVLTVADHPYLHKRIMAPIQDVLFRIAQELEVVEEKIRGQEEGS